ncbi:hypothetical protein CMQ_6883 [Grosmannia clavigera kw1407]|uniref:Uncharacterized protein n=1 Tax=Grosmannia clavigera (strain kw1407 / UAMH 11150) TaxID=655863 RepID=F0X6K6_GROCL|nr:uncharacterized protein CMQ_6883 [Grosmannia clavigera kw1407]EFX06562.1 hypothetical protein CMQ_6883 [Grosmannia clavigera kw1407]
MPSVYCHYTYCEAEAVPAGENVLTGFCYRQKHWSASGEARLGLKCLGVTPTPNGSATVSIQFVWMPQQKAPPRGQPKTWIREDAWRQPVCMDARGGEHWVADWRERPRYGTALRPGTEDANIPGAAIPVDPGSKDGIVAAVDVRTGRPLRSGATFSVSLPLLVDAYNMKAMLDLQWACINIASMSGASGSADFLAADEFDDAFSEGLVAAGIVPSLGPLGVTSKKRPKDQTKQPSMIPRPKKSTPAAKSQLVLRPKLDPAHGSATAIVIAEQPGVPKSMSVTVTEVSIPAAKKVQLPWVPAQPWS